MSDYIPDIKFETYGEEYVYVSDAARIMSSLAEEIGCAKLDGINSHPGIRSTFSVAVTNSDHIDATPVGYTLDMLPGCGCPYGVTLWVKLSNSDEYNKAQTTIEVLTDENTRYRNTIEAMHKDLTNLRQLLRSN